MISLLLSALLIVNLIDTNSTAWPITADGMGSVYGTAMSVADKRLGLSVVLGELDQFKPIDVGYLIGGESG